MFFNDLVARAQDRLAKRNRYRQMIAEIESLSDRDLADMGGNRSEMRYHVYRSVYGG
jgi:uncharacterized protein YjiS (DUF1127 family)